MSSAPAVKEFLKQGFLAATTGGLLYDNHAGTVTNIVHLYTFLLLMFIPYTLYLSIPESDSHAYLVWSALYTASTVLFFTFVKVSNILLHRAFDKLASVPDEVRLDDITSLPTDPTSYGRYSSSQSQLQSALSRGPPPPPPPSGDPNALAGGIRRRRIAAPRRSAVARRRQRNSISEPEGNIEVTVLDESAIVGVGDADDLSGASGIVTSGGVGVDAISRGKSDWEKPSSADVSSSLVSAPSGGSFTFAAVALERQRSRPRSRTGQNVPRDGLRELEVLSMHSMEDGGGIDSPSIVMETGRTSRTHNDSDGDLGLGLERLRTVARQVSNEYSKGRSASVVRDEGMDGSRTRKEAHGKLSTRAKESGLPRRVRNEVTTIRWTSHLHTGPLHRLWWV
eukprot:Opistho-2@60236